MTFDWLSFQRFQNSRKLSQTDGTNDHSIDYFQESLKLMKFSDEVIRVFVLSIAMKKKDARERLEKNSQRNLTQKKFARAWTNLIVQSTKKK